MCSPETSLSDGAQNDRTYITASTDVLTKCLNRIRNRKSFRFIRITSPDHYFWSNISEICASLLIYDEALEELEFILTFFLPIICCSKLSSSERGR